jgi:hypothetical protein
MHRFHYHKLGKILSESFHRFDTRQVHHQNPQKSMRLAENQPKLQLLSQTTADTYDSYKNAGQLVSPLFCNEYLHTNNPQCILIHTRLPSAFGVYVCQFYSHSQ